MGKKIGRPEKINARRQTCKTRMTDEEKFIFNRACKKEGYSEAEGLRKAAKAFIFLSEKGLINWATESDKDDFLNYCGPEINDEDEDNELL